MNDTCVNSEAYARRLQALESVWWKRLLPVQWPYGWNLRRLRPGFTLDVGCGLGRNLAHLGGHGVGVDTNAECVAVARARGFLAFRPQEFRESEWHRPGRFDSLLFSHVLEHMPRGEAAQLVADYVPLVRSGGRVVVITPQECGFRSDPTHVEFVDFAATHQILRSAGVEPVRSFSFPFPRVVGKFFRFNEFVVAGEVQHRGNTRSSGACPRFETGS